MPEKKISALIEKYKQSGKNSYFDADEFCKLADHYDSIDELDIAREIIDAGLSIHPGNLSLLVKKAKLIVYDGDYKLALDLLKQTTEYDFDLYLLRIECFLQLGLYQDALNQSAELIEKEDSEPLDNVLAELGFLYIEADCFKEATLYFEKSLKYNPENTDVLSDLAYAHETLGNFHAAIDSYNRILDIEPYSYDAWINVGKLYTLAEEYENAIDAFDFALTINDFDNNVIKLKAHCLLLSGRIDEAIDIFKNLLKSGGEDTSLYFLLSECYQSLELYEIALSYLNKYEEIEGITMDLIIKKAYLFIDKGDFKSASAIIKDELEEASDSSDLIILAGEIEFRQENLDEAEKFFTEALFLSENNSHIIDRLSIINIKKENYEEAIQYTKTLLELNPDDLAIKQRLTLLYFEIDDKMQFDELLDEFNDEQLLSLFNLIYTSESSDYFDREMLISYLNKAREIRILFKNLKY
ncbi:MAG: tetratricopeptide repeat protein [Dysgonomonas sp.]|nr:tetratricopeptide repeat protein [Dysgonomonas sp.]